MGTLCNKKNIKITTKKQILTINPTVNDQNIDDQNNLKRVSICQGTFIEEKNYNNFIKEYEILEFIGKGAFGTVHKVRHRLTNQLRAMKIIHKSSFDIDQEKILLREINILKLLNHPHILKLYEFFSDEKNYYMITEFCNGGELFDKLQEVGSLDEKLAAKLMKNILQAVAYLHSINIVHRDLKPENILLEYNNDKEFAIKIIDFGTSRSLMSNVELTEKTGTPYYIAPEVLKKSYNEKCDLWSCGVILYILLSGEPPFNGRSDTEILKNVEIGIANLNIEEFKHVSKDAKFLIRKLLEYNSTKRFTAVEALETKWIKEQAPNSNLNSEIASTILSRLKSFRADKKLQEATFAYIVNQLLSKEETIELKKVFMELDTNNDGKLSYEEIVEGYKKIYGSINPEIDAKMIFNAVDSDHNGYISYEEFIRATVDRVKILTDKKLESAFNLFDKNGDGFISASEIKEVLGKDSKTNDEIWKGIVKEVDINGDGEISLEEFKNMMEKILNINILNTDKRILKE